MRQQGQTWAATLLVTAAVMGIAACNDGTLGGPGAADARGDAGAAPLADAGAASVDTGAQAADTGAQAADTGAPAADTSAPAADTSVQPSDTGAPPPDTSTAPDTSPPADNGTSPADQASGPDAPPMPGSTQVVLLHHSVGFGVYSAGSAAGGGMVGWFADYNAAHGTSYQISEIFFPVTAGNHPVNYWDIWVNHAGPQPYNGDPTLEVLTQTYQVVIWKHCFFSCFIEADTGSPDIAASGTASALRLENYKLQYAALKQKMLSFPNTRFIVWTLPVCTEAGWQQTMSAAAAQAQAQRAKDFATWVKTVWDDPGDNIYVWDFNQLETQGGLYFTNPADPTQCHPPKSFNESVQPPFGNRIVNVIEGRGDSTSLTGE